MNSLGKHFFQNNLETSKTTIHLLFLYETLNFQHAVTQIKPAQHRMYSVPNIFSFKTNLLVYNTSLVKRA